MRPGPEVLRDLRRRVQSGARAAMERQQLFLEVQVADDGNAPASADPCYVDQFLSWSASR